MERSPISRKRFCWVRHQGAPSISRIALLPPIRLPRPAASTTTVEESEHGKRLCLKEQLPAFLAWAQRFFDASAPVEVDGDGLAQTGTGPWLATADEIADVQALDMKLSVNGHTYQDGNTRTMIYKPAFYTKMIQRKGKTDIRFILGG